MKKLFVNVLLSCCSMLLLGGQAFAVPQAPVLSVGTTGNNVAAQWSEVAGATGYTLFYAPSPFAGEETIKSLDMGTNLYFSGDLPTGAAFFVAVSAYDATGTSGYSNIQQFVIDPNTVIDNPVPPETALQLNSVRRLAEARPDECYVEAERVSEDIEDGYLHPGGVPPLAPEYDGEDFVCQDDATPKTNESYVWGMAKSGDRLWLGSGANVQCLVQGAYLGLAWPAERNTGTEEVTQVCEFGASWLLAGEGSLLPEYLGDWRAPAVHFYDLANSQMHYNVEQEGLINDPIGLARLRITLGLRSAGSIGDIVFLAGADFTKAVNVFAFRSSTGEYLGSHSLANYSNIRKWRVVGGHLYTALASSGDNISDGMYGHVLKWVGTDEAPLVGPNGSSPFVVVGLLPGQGAELSEYGEDRLAVSTWPGGFDELSEGALDPDAMRHAGIYLSDAIGEDGLDPATADSNFTEIFTYADYDPDRVRAFTYGGGALAYYDGSLFWGSMHVPGTAWLAFSRMYGPYGLEYTLQSCRDIIGATEEICPMDQSLDNMMDPGYLTNACVAQHLADASAELQQDFATCLGNVEQTWNASNLAISVFRGTNLEAEEGAREIDLLYGYETMPSYIFDSFFGIPQYGAGSWQDVPNGIGAPLFGEAGFGNSTNNYTWEMRTINDRLFVGTMDQQSIFDVTDPDAGFDIYSFSSAHRAAVKEDGGGLGNPFNYGTRTLLPGNDNKLYVGTANPFNLAPENAGGWELLEVEVE
ncbi:MAG: hypothetical protein OET90_05875 [Desulfuromonadales bacterium]|nr:hypothetical protein [Desulfuromonadales bacterium]